MDVAGLEAKARSVRAQALEYTVATRKGHLGGTFSCTDVLVALYYGGLLRVDPARPAAPERDRFILSKGHACLALLPILVDLGVLPRARLDTYGDDGGLGGQLDVSIPGVDWNTGSLGHALGVCAGMALAAKLDRRDWAAFTLLGDAELAEGSIWEALAFASDHGLDNLVAIVDRNRLSVLDPLDDDAIFRRLPATLEAFGWDCFEMDGHAFPAILETVARARRSSRPALVVAHTVKGKGVSFMEHAATWHAGVPTAEEAAIARRELAGGVRA